jgi:hypothetical protein
MGATEDPVHPRQAAQCRQARQPRPEAHLEARGEVYEGATRSLATALQHAEQQAHAHGAGRVCIRCRLQLQRSVREGQGTGCALISSPDCIQVHNKTIRCSVNSIPPLQ